MRVLMLFLVANIVACSGSKLTGQSHSNQMSENSKPTLPNPKTPTPDKPQEPDFYITALNPPTGNIGRKEKMGYVQMSPESLKISIKGYKKYRYQIIRSGQFDLEAKSQNANEFGNFKFKSRFNIPDCDSNKSIESDLKAIAVKTYYSEFYKVCLWGVKDDGELVLSDQKISWYDAAPIGHERVVFDGSEIGAVSLEKHFISPIKLYDWSIFGDYKYGFSVKDCEFSGDHLVLSYGWTKSELSDEYRSRYSLINISKKSGVTIPSHKACTVKFDMVINGKKFSEEYSFTTR